MRHGWAALTALAALTVTWVATGSGVASASAPPDIGNLRGGDGVVLARSSYDYAPSVMQDGGYKMWWCAGVAGDYILYAEADKLPGPWHGRGNGTPNSTTVALKPTNGTGNFDNLHTCDPSVVRVGDTYYMYYGALKSGENEPTTIGLATSSDGVHFTRANGGRPIIVPARDVSGVPNKYGAGQPSVTHVGGKFYLTYTDTTGYAVDGNGGGQFVLRSSDPAFQNGVEELTKDGFAPRTAQNHTRHSLVAAFSVDWQYSDLLQGFVMAIDASSGQTRFKTFDRTLSREVLEEFSVPASWREGPGLVSRPDKHAVPSARCGVVPFDYVRAVGGDEPGSWDLSHRGFDLRTGRSCDQSNLPAVLNGYRMQSAGLPLALVAGEQRLQFGLAAPAVRISRNSIDVSSEVYHKVPYGGSIQPGQRVLGASGRPAAFDADGKLWPVSCLEAITDNQSSITMIGTAEWDRRSKGASLQCVKD